MEGIVKKLLVMLAFVASTAHGEVYSWTDSRGTVHYTNRMDEIPVRFRAKAKSLNYGEEPQAGTASPQGHDQVQPARTAEQPAARNPGGNFARQKAPGPPVELNAGELQQKRAERKQEIMKARATKASKEGE